MTRLPRTRPLKVYGVNVFATQVKAAEVLGVSASATYTNLWPARIVDGWMMVVED